MAGVLEIMARFEALDIDAIAENSILETGNEMVQLNRDQMLAGLRSDDTKIKPEYSGTTIVEKERKGQPYDHVTLYDTGEFQGEMVLTVTKEQAFITSLSEKTDKLEEKYDTTKGHILGLGPTRHNRYLNEYLRAKWKQKVEAATQLKMQ